MAKKNKTRRKKGGQAIASGAFGCVFKPALRCQSKKTREKNKISKLMITEDALDEYKEVQNILIRLKPIPNYKHYFVIDNFNMCIPNKLTKRDLTNFETKCRALPKNNISSQNINHSLHLIRTLNMPDGGLPIDKYLKQHQTDEDCVNLNNKLIDLLVNGILKMNAAHIYHSDIKYDNVLVERKRSNVVYTRLIDWGLSTEYVPFQHNSFPSTWHNRSILFNAPFSIIVFSETFASHYTSYVQTGGKINANSLKHFVSKYLDMWMKKAGEGQLRYVKEIMYMLFIPILNKDDNIERKRVDKEITFPYIINYVVQVLLHYTKFRENGTLDLRHYLDNLFIKILDVYGFILTYVVVFEMIREKQITFRKQTSKENQILHFIKLLFIKYLFEPCIKPFDIDDLTRTLKDLNILLLEKE